MFSLGSSPESPAVDDIRSGQAITRRDHHPRYRLAGRDAIPGVRFPSQGAVVERGDEKIQCIQGVGPSAAGGRRCFVGLEGVGGRRAGG